MMQGMVDPGEVVTTTVKREFIEEAMDSLAFSEDDQKRMNQQISDFFKKYSEVRHRFVELFTGIRVILKKLEMSANAQRDGCPAEYRWCPLFNAAKFG